MTNLQIEPQLQQATPSLIFETLHRYQHTMALKAAIDLEVFTHIAGGAATPAAIAALSYANERGVRILCDFLTILGFLRKSGSGYSLTRDSSIFLDKRSPAYTGSVVGFLSSPVTLDLFRDLAAVVRNGGPLNGSGHMLPDNDIWVKFANSMAPMIAPVADAVANAVAAPGRRLKVLDIAAGHGMFGISVARRNPQAEIVAVDWKNVLGVAERNAARAGVQDRFRTIPGSVFEVDIESRYDLVVVANFLHCFDIPTNIGLLKKVWTAMKPGGLLATVELVPNEDRISPPIAASFSMNMLGATNGGDAYTFSEFDRMFRAAGFDGSRMQLLEPTPHALILTAR